MNCIFSCAVGGAVRTVKSWRKICSKPVLAGHIFLDLSLSPFDWPTVAHRSQFFVRRKIMNHIAEKKGVKSFTSTLEDLTQLSKSHKATLATTIQPTSIPNICWTLGWQRVTDQRYSSSLHSLADYLPYKRKTALKHIHVGGKCGHRCSNPISLGCVCVSPHSNSEEMSQSRADFFFHNPYDLMDFSL